MIVAGSDDSERKSRGSASFHVASSVQLLNLYSISLRHHTRASLSYVDDDMMMNYDGMKPLEQYPVSLWFEGMPRHGDGVEHCDEISNGLI